MVETVARLRHKEQAVVDEIFEKMRNVVQGGRFALERYDLVALGEAMNICQTLLRGLAVSTPEIEWLCRIAKRAGALGAKLTGSGGGGCVIALAEEPERVVKAWDRAGFSGFVASLSDAT